MQQNPKTEAAVFAMTGGDGDDWNSRVIAWATDHNMTGYVGWEIQYAKLVQAVGKLGDTFCSRTNIAVLNAIGEVEVMLAVLAAKRSGTLEQCREMAWSVIEDREKSGADCWP